MNRNQVEHAIQSISSVLEIKNIKNKIIVVGSQSLYGQIKEAEQIESVHQSKEIDILFEKEEHADLITGVLGELSQFDTTYNYYVDGIFKNHIKLPKNYKNRLVNFKLSNGNTIQVLNIHDYIVCKLFANREKDRKMIEDLMKLNNLKISKERLLKIMEEYPETNTQLIEFVKNRIINELKFSSFISDYEIEIQ